MKLLRITPGIHRVLKHPCLRHLQRTLKDPSLFTYWHVKRKVWVIASWFNKSSRACIEHCPFDGDSGLTVNDAVAAVKIQKSKQAINDMKSMLYDADRTDGADEAQGEDEEFLDAISFVKHRAGDHYKDHPSWSYLE